MKIIELEHWETMPEEPRRLRYAGQPMAAEVFKELKYRLESQGYLPDEYFLLDIKWENLCKLFTMNRVPLVLCLQMP